MPRIKARSTVVASTATVIYGAAGLQRRATVRADRRRHPKVFQLKDKSEDLDGVMISAPAGKPLAHIRLPERCANLGFGRPKNNRLYMTSCRSVYALYVKSHRVGVSWSLSFRGCEAYRKEGANWPQN